MTDFNLIAVTLVFFAVAAAYTAGCQRLREPRLKGGNSND